MAIPDKILGAMLLTASIIIFIYYSIWVLVLPFIHSSRPIHQYFFDPIYAIIVPAILLVVGVASIALFIGIIMLKESRKVKII
jgi:dolichyl-phosphate mannosyltransferase polypeptide 2 regulatory subunit